MHSSVINSDWLINRIDSADLKIVAESHSRRSEAVQGGFEAGDP